MSDRKDLAGVQVDICSTPEVLLKISDYLTDEILRTVGMIYMKTIVAAGEDERISLSLADMDLALPSDREILTELGVTDPQYLADVEENRLPHEVFDQIVRENSSVYLLASGAEQLEQMRDFLAEVYAEDLNICGSCIPEEDSADAERVVNEINAASAHVIISMLPAVQQEYFLYEHRRMLNARLWFGIGAENDLLSGKNNPRDFYRKRMDRRRLKKQIQSYETEGEEN